ncbi:MAG: hypothetical protein OQK24_02830 [Magnetovibrio sp.]|nr:hypothetical protein [Magnetovibrio sp.]
MRFLIFNIVVVGAMVFLVMDRPELSESHNNSAQLTIPMDMATPAPSPQKPKQRVEPPQAEKTAASVAVKKLSPSHRAEEPTSQNQPTLPELPPAQEVPVRVTHEAPRDVSPIEVSKIETHTTKTQAEPTITTSTTLDMAEIDTVEPNKSNDRRKALYDLASDMERMFAEKMMR